MRTTITRKATLTEDEVRLLIAEYIRKETGDEVRVHKISTIPVDPPDFLQVEYTIERPAPTQKV